MGLFDKFKKNKFYDGFKEWLDEQFPRQEVDAAVAFCFLLYEDTDYRWSVELVGTSKFSEKDADWACAEVLATREHPYVIQYDGTFREVLEIFKKCAAAYLDKGKYKDLLKEKAGVGIGFVDGDLELLYQNPNYRPSSEANHPDKAMEEKQKQFQQRFEQNLKYISQSEISVKTIEKQFVNDDKHHCMPVGKAHFPTGRVIVADPLAYLPSNKYSPELEIRIPKGAYPVDVSIYRNDEIGIRMCTTRLRVKDAQVMRYVRAASTKESAVAANDKEAISGFPVDAGMMTICDVKVADEYREFLDQWYRENPGKNHYDDYFAAFFAQSYEMFPAYQREGGDFMVWINPIHRRNMVMVASGFGDGFYQCYIGYDENEEVCQIIVPMVNPDLFEDNDTIFSYTAALPADMQAEVLRVSDEAKRYFHLVNPQNHENLVKQIHEKVDALLKGKPYPSAYSDLKNAAIALGARFGYELNQARGWKWMMVGNSEEAAEVCIVSPKENYCIFPLSYMLKILEGRNIGTDGKNDNTVLLLWNMTENIDDQPKDKKFIPLS